MATQNLYAQPMVSIVDLPISATFTTKVVDATNTGMASFFRYEGGHGNLVGCVSNRSAISGTPTIRFSLQGITSRDNPDGTIKTSTTNKVDVTTPAAGISVNTFDASYAGSDGDLLSLVCLLLSGTTSATFNAGVGGNGLADLPYTALSTTGTWSHSSTMPCLAPVYNDGYIGRGFYPANTMTNTIPTSGSNPLWYGNIWTQSVAGVFAGCNVYVRAAAGSSFVCNLYEGTNTTAVSTSGAINPDLAFGVVSAVRQHYIPMPAYTLAAGTTYRLALSMTTGTAFNTWAMSSFASAAQFQAVGGMLSGGCTSPSSIAWTDYASGSDYRIYPIIPLIKSFDSGSGSGGIRRGIRTGGRL